MQEFISKFSAFEIEQAIDILIGMKREDYKKVLDCLIKEEKCNFVRKIYTDCDFLNIEKDNNNNIKITVDEEKIKDKFVKKIIKCGIIKNTQIANDDIVFEKENDKEIIFEFEYTWNTTGYIYIVIPRNLNKKILVDNKEIEFNIKEEKENCIYISKKEFNIKKCNIRIVEV